MSKEVFNNLPENKKEKVIGVLKEIFQAKPFQNVTVKEIVEKLDIARGSFYQYFENLEDAYFTILDMELVDIHLMFLKIFKEENHNLQRSLKKYGEALVKILFEEETYYMYANFFLYCDEYLYKAWNKLHMDQLNLFTGKDEEIPDMEKIQFIKGIIHSLIQRNYKENWTKEKFMQVYKQYIYWIKKGVN